MVCNCVYELHSVLLDISSIYNAGQKFAKIKGKEHRCKIRIYYEHLIFWFKWEKMFLFIQWVYHKLSWWTWMNKNNLQFSEKIKQSMIKMKMNI